MDLSQGSSFPLMDLVIGTLAMVSNEKVAYNTLILGSFLIAGITMYALAYYLVRSVWAGVVAGTVYAFFGVSPDDFACLSWRGEHSVASAVRLDAPSDRRGRRMAGGGTFALALFLLFSFSYYQTYFMVVFTFLYLGVRYWYEREAGAKEFSGSSDAWRSGSA